MYITWNTNIINHFYYLFYFYIFKFNYYNKYIIFIINLYVKHFLNFKYLIKIIVKFHKIFYNNNTRLNFVRKKNSHDFQNIINNIIIIYNL